MDYFYFKNIFPISQIFFNEHILLLSIYIVSDIEYFFKKALQVHLKSHFTLSETYSPAALSRVNHPLEVDMNPPFMPL